MSDATSTPPPPSPMAIEVESSVIEDVNKNNPKSEETSTTLSISEIEEEVTVEEEDKKEEEEKEEEEDEEKKNQPLVEATPLPETKDIDIDKEEKEKMSKDDKKTRKLKESVDYLINRSKLESTIVPVNQSNIAPPGSGYKYVGQLEFPLGTNLSTALRRTISSYYNWIEDAFLADTLSLNINKYDNTSNIPISEAVGTVFLPVISKETKLLNPELREQLLSRGVPTDRVDVIMSSTEYYIQCVKFPQFYLNQQRSNEKWYVGIPTPIIWYPSGKHPIKIFPSFEPYHKTYSNSVTIAGAITFPVGAPYFQLVIEARLMELLMRMIDYYVNNIPSFNPRKHVLLEYDLYTHPTETYWNCVFLRFITRAENKNVFRTNASLVQMNFISNGYSSMMEHKKWARVKPGSIILEEEKE